MLGFYLVLPPLEPPGLGGLVIAGGQLRDDRPAGLPDGQLRVQGGLLVFNYGQLRDDRQRNRHLDGPRGGVCWGE